MQLVPTRGKVVSAVIAKAGAAAGAAVVTVQWSRTKLFEVTHTQGLQPWSSAQAHTDSVRPGPRRCYDTLPNRDPRPCGSRSVRCTSQELSQCRSLTRTSTATTIRNVVHSHSQTIALLFVHLLQNSFAPCGARAHDLLIKSLAPFKTASYECVPAEMARSTTALIQDCSIRVCARRHGEIENRIHSRFRLTSGIVLSVICRFGSARRLRELLASRIRAEPSLVSLPEWLRGWTYDSLQATARGFELHR
jgi:hypothetical protein